MNGQWLGEFSGSSKGRIILNIDDLSSHFEGVAFLHSDNVVPSVAVGFHTQNKDRTFSCRTDWIYPIDRNSGMITPWEGRNKGVRNHISHTNPCDIAPSMLIICTSSIKWFLTPFLSTHSYPHMPAIEVRQFGRICPIPLQHPEDK